MAIASGKHEVRPAAWLKETWQWRVTCGERCRYFLTERAAKAFLRNNDPGCELISRADHDEAQDILSRVRYEDLEAIHGTVHQGSE